MIKIVNGSKLKGNVIDDQEHFYGVSGRKTEEEYRQLLEDSQKYFDGIKNGSIQTTEEYFIYAPEFYLKHGLAKEIAVIKNDSTAGINARLLYIEDPIKVKAISNGYIFSGHDGRHRYTTAQKYKLDLLVDVEEEKLSEVEVKDNTRGNLVIKILTKIITQKKGL